MENLITIEFVAPKQSTMQNAADYRPHLCSHFESYPPSKKKNILIVAQWACIQYNVQNVQDINKVGKPFGKKVQITKTVYNNIGGRYVV